MKHKRIRGLTWSRLNDSPRTVEPRQRGAEVATHGRFRALVYRASNDRHVWMVFLLLSKSAAPLVQGERVSRKRAKQEASVMMGALAKNALSPGHTLGNIFHYDVSPWPDKAIPATQSDKGV